jgi:tRNA-binding protein
MAEAKAIADFAHFEALDIRVGRIVKVEDAQTRKPIYRMTLDFGPEIGTKVSCGAYRNYPRDALVGQQVLAVVNFTPRQMGPEISEVLVLGSQREWRHDHCDAAAEGRSGCRAFLGTINGVLSKFRSLG